MKPLLFLALLATAALAFADEFPAKVAKALAPAAKELPDSVVVIGAVRSPQTIRYHADIKLSEALGAAGGVSEFGPSPIYVIRNGATKHKTITKRIHKDPKTEDITLLPWDIVCVDSPKFR